MWKKVVFLAVGILAIAAILGVAVSNVKADDASAKKTGPFQGRVCPGGPVGPGNGEMLTRVAQILGIDEQKLTDAFKQAGTELAKNRLDGMFAKWVADGKLTQAQADQYRDWLKARPEGVPGFGMGSGNQAMMSKLLENGKITQEQFDLWKAWMDQKPDIELPRPERPSGAPAGPRCDKATATS